MKIFPSKRQWKDWTLPSKATYVGVCLTVVALILTAIGLAISKKFDIKGDYVAGDKSGDIHTQGDYVSGDKVTYNTYVNHYASEANRHEVVSDASLRNFFSQYSSTFTAILSKLPEEQLHDLPGFLQKPYSMNIVVSSSHGIGFEYTVPSDIPEIDLIHTTVPIERHFFTKYTDKPDFHVSTKFIKISKEDILWMNYNFVGSKQVFWVIENADLQAVDIGIKYSEDDEFKNIKYLWLFGSNSNEYWSQKDPVELAKKNVTRLIKTYIVKEEAEASYNTYKQSNKGMQ